MLVTELMPVHSSRKSFHRKAMVILEGERVILMSYDSFMIEIIGDKVTILRDWFSMTTLSHMKEFLLQFTGKEYKKADYVKALTTNNGILV